MPFRAPLLSVDALFFGGVKRNHRKTKKKYLIQLNPTDMSKKNSLYLFKSRRINKHEKRRSRFIILTEKKTFFQLRKFSSHTHLFTTWELKNILARVLLTFETIE